MKVTLSVIKADVGSIGGHVAPSVRLKDAVRAYVLNHKHGLFADLFVSHTGDDIAILMVLLAPLKYEATPVTAQDIRTRLLDIAFNATFLREMRMFARSTAPARPNIPIRCR